MQAVWVRFGGNDGGKASGAVVLALQTAAEVLVVDGQRCVAVLVPTAPVPIGGGLLFVPEGWVTHAALSIEAVMSLYVSMGVTAPQHLPVAGAGVGADGAAEGAEGAAETAPESAIKLAAVTPATVTSTT